MSKTDEGMRLAKAMALASFHGYAKCAEALRAHLQSMEDAAQAQQEPAAYFIEFATDENGRVRFEQVGQEHEGDEDVTPLYRSAVLAAHTGEAQDAPSGYMDALESAIAKTTRLPEQEISNDPPLAIPVDTEDQEREASEMFSSEVELKQIEFSDGSKGWQIRSPWLWVWIGPTERPGQFHTIFKDSSGRIGEGESVASLPAPAGER